MAGRENARPFIVADNDSTDHESRARPFRRHSARHHSLRLRLSGDHLRQSVPVPYIPPALNHRLHRRLALCFRTILTTAILVDRRLSRKEIITLHVFTNEIYLYLQIYRISINTDFIYTFRNVILRDNHRPSTIGHNAGLQ